VGAERPRPDGQPQQRSRDLQEADRHLSGQSKQYQDALQQWAGWWKDIEPHWKDVEGFLRQRQAGGRPATAGRCAAQAADAISSSGARWSRTSRRGAWPTTWRSSSSRASAATGVNCRSSGGEGAGLPGRRLQQQAQQQQNYMNVWSKAWEAKQRNPDLDITRRSSRAVAVLSGKVDPLELGIKLSTADQDREADRKKQRELWEQERKAEEAKKSMAAPLTGATHRRNRAQPEPRHGRGDPAGRDREDLGGKVRRGDIQPRAVITSAALFLANRDGCRTAGP